MAEYNCSICKKTIRTGDKFTFTKNGAVHLDCFVAEKRTKIPEEKAEELRILSLILDSHLQSLVNVLSIEAKDEKIKEIKNENVKNIEKIAGELTKKISDL